MLRRIEKKTAFMKKIEEVAVKHGIEKIYSKGFTGDVVVDTTFLVDVPRNSEAFKAMYSVLENPMGYTEKDFEDDDLFIHGTNRVYYKELGIIGLTLIYDKGDWYYAD